MVSLFRSGDSEVNGDSQNPAIPLRNLPNGPLFGTDGIRGKAGELLDANFALQLGYWAGRVLQNNVDRKGPVIIGQDSRNSSDMLSMAITSGLASAGVEVWQLGLCPTPCVAYLTHNSNAIGGIMISASHNPPEDNGIKFFSSEGKKLSKDLIQSIEAGLRGNLHLDPQKSSWGKSFYRPLLVRDYQEFLQNTLPSDLRFQGQKIVLDLAWGAAVNIAPEIFTDLGAEVILLHDRADGDQINVDCGSTHLARLQRAVQEHQATIGFAFDGDADRVILVDQNGRVVDGDHILYFWGQKLQQQNRLPDNLIIGTVMANLGFERAWESLGGQLIRTAVGDQYVQEMMWKRGAMLGGEQSGHILCHHHNISGDGIQTALHLTAFLQQEQMTLAQWLEESFQTYPQILRNIRVEDAQKRREWQKCEPLQSAINQAEDELGESGRILVRASGTEPLIRIMVEACSAQDAQYWSEYLVETVNRTLVS
jgi:phosphoglucosamine mutase